MSKVLKTPTGKLGDKPADLKRVEIYLTNETYSVLEKKAKTELRSTKNFMETVLMAKAQLLIS